MGLKKVEYEFPDPDKSDEEGMVDIEIEPSSMTPMGEEIVGDVDDETNITTGDDEVDTSPKDDLEIEVVDDTPPEDQNRVPSDPPEDVTEDELKQLNEKTRQRIKHFTKGYHDERREKETAIRERKALEEYARNLMAKNEQLQATVGKSQSAILEQAKVAVTSELEQAKAEFTEAHEAGDSKGVAAAQEKWTAAQMRAEKINNIKLPSLQEQTDAVQRGQESESQTHDVLDATPQVDPRAQEWAKENPWFGVDEEMTGFALVVHNKLANSGISPQSDEYYEKINSRMRKMFSENFEDTTDKDEDTKSDKGKQSQIVASATRTTAPKKITLKKSEVAIANRLGVPLKEYAEQVAMLSRKNENG